MWSWMLAYAMVAFSAISSTDAYPIYPDIDGMQGGKETLQDDNPNNLMEDVKTILWKLAAADKLRNQFVTKADQSAQKPSKRACFWKYCVTN